MNTRFVFVTGGVVSSLGKGILAASLGRLLRARQLSASIVKLDPYLNVDPGTMSPYQHGEVFVTEDGAETDLDLGHYERFIDVNLGRMNNITAGAIYKSVLEKERKGDYLGGTVQMIPHVTNEIKNFLRKGALQSKAHVIIVEVGGTVGDIESLIFLEAIRQMRKDVGRDNCCYIHVTMIPDLKTTSELKTKPTQHSVDTLRSRGIQPDILACRTERNIGTSIREKLSLFTDVDLNCVIQCRDVQHLYEVPLRLEEEGLAERVLEKLRLPNMEPDLDAWKNLVERVKNPTKQVTVAIVGKYVMLSDAYISVVESLKHAGAALSTQVNIKWVLSEDIEKNGCEAYLTGVDGILVPGGFGDRGIEGKVSAAGYAREHKLPYLGLCLGMQIAVIEFARNVAKMEKAHSTEFDAKSPYPVIDLMPDQHNVTHKGGTMRLGKYPCTLKAGTVAARVYGTTEISERHRHRYEVNNDLRAELAKNGLVFSGLSPDERLVEMIELTDHPYFVACQFHPELKSRPDKPHPLFVGLVEAMVKHSELNGGGKKSDAENAKEQKAIAEKASAENAKAVSVKATQKAQA
ncbi:MAG: CTP synthase [Candidatus Obscuribacter sp.]|jgi:CTP synthase|nr:CTP synthase [Candidatus Obscuribacter sp.]